VFANICWLSCLECYNPEYHMEIENILNVENILKCQSLSMMVKLGRQTVA